MEIRVIRAKEVELPVPVEAAELDPELKKLHEKFAAGGELTRDEFKKLLAHPLRAEGNHNCNIC